MNNIGYVIIVLKKNAVEKTMPKWIEGNLTATVYYDAEKAFGTGKSQYYVPVVDDLNWSEKYKEYSFWQGKGYLRVSDIQNGTVKVLVYSDKEHIFRELVLKEGETSKDIYFPGFYCMVALQVKLNKVTSPDKQVKLNVDGEELWLREGSRFLNDRCYVSKINALLDGSGSVVLNCPGGSINLMKQRQGAVLQINNNRVSKKIGEVVGNNYYLAYVGQMPKNVLLESWVVSNNERFALVLNKELTAGQLNDIAVRISDVSQNTQSQISWNDFMSRISLGNSAIVLLFPILG